MVLVSNVRTHQSEYTNKVHTGTVKQIIIYANIHTKYTLLALEYW